MVSTYTITVKNQSGVQRKYALLNKKPKVTGTVQGEVWSNVFATKTLSVDYRATFKLTNKYYAVVGSSDGNPGDAVHMDISGNHEVTLGVKTETGGIIPGSTLKMVVDDDVPQLSTETFPNSSLANAFEIQTGEFSTAKAKKGKYMIGVGGSTNGTGLSGAQATFCPEPLTTYQIEPSNTYYLTWGKYEQGDLVNYTEVANIKEIDFTKLPNEIAIIHDDCNRLEIQE
ncbi:sulfatase [Fusarium subglutinans]|uniref:Sulfatase n=1 Tax=Gibberella subglutinans TaxID=42677 RepID=A0A8H5PBY9_GIBSU|nr:sulfatase [Fusarium subglutinans]KAF5593865.1 sulfatase [Fusarium subglutinans]